MSPSEFDLRAALRDGEGDVPDAGVLIAGAERLRRERRRRLTAVASTVIVVAGIVTGGTALVRSQHEEAGSSGMALGSGAARARSGAAYAPDHSAPGSLKAANGTTGSVSTSTQDSASAALACPRTVPRLMLPGGGGTDQFGADGPLFAGKVSAITVCAFGGPHAGSAFVDQNAQQVADRLEAEPVHTADNAQCKLLGSYALYAVTPDGDTLPVVTAEGGCAQYTLTNGTATRSVPVDDLRALVPLPRATPSSGNVGTPSR